MLTLAITIVLIVAATAAVYFIARHLNKKASDIKSADTASLKIEIFQADQALKKSLNTLQQMIPLSEQIEIERACKEKGSLLEAEQNRFREINAKLEEMKNEIARQEEKLSHLKKGKEASFRLAEEIKANSEQLEAEKTRLEAELSNSKDQMIALKSELELTADQSDAVDDLYKALDEAAEKLRELSESHEIASERFLNLQIQYEELEKEYAKLIAKELNPE